MELILIGLLVSLIAGCQFIVDAMLESIVPMGFYAETYMMGLVSNNVNFAGITSLFFRFGVSLIVLKFLKKGFDIYVGWHDGDADADPFDLVVGFLRAMVIAICFPMLYDLLVDVVSQMIDLSIVELNAMATHKDLITAILDIIADSLLQAIAGLVMIICYCVLWFQFMGRGVEMLVMRIGLPIACVGLIDSDKGVFAPYMKKFFMNAATILVQILLVKLSLTVMMLGSMFYAIAIAMAAIKTPKFLQEFMLNSGGGGNALGTAFHVQQLVKSISKA